MQVVLRQLQANLAAAGSRGDALLHSNAILRQACQDANAIADSLRTHIRSKVTHF